MDNLKVLKAAPKLLTYAYNNKDKIQIVNYTYKHNTYKNSPYLTVADFVNRTYQLAKFRAIELRLYLFAAVF